MTGESHACCTAVSTALQLLALSSSESSQFLNTTGRSNQMDSTSKNIYLKTHYLANKSRRQVEEEERRNCRGQATREWVFWWGTGTYPSETSVDRRLHGT